MCGRYALALPPSAVRRRLQDGHMPAMWEGEDDDVRQTYNFAPGYHGLVYRADIPERQPAAPREDETSEVTDTGTKAVTDETEEHRSYETPQYKLQAMKWGLIPFWTKRNPDYGSMMKTINCRDDSLATRGGMWQTMKQKKRCIVVCEGFYEWLKKNGGKERVPHFVKRKDGQLMCFAGLWDSVQYEDTTKKLYTYAIITTDSNKQLTFLHDRMPVILNNGSKEMFQWLDSTKTEWSNELQSLLKPYAGELECYPVIKDVGKVGNDSPTFVVPVDSSENKQNIANFFGNQKKAVMETQATTTKVVEIDHVPGEHRETVKGMDEEDNAPKPVAAGHKRSIEAFYDDGASAGEPASKSQNKGKSGGLLSSKKNRSATSNNTATKESPSKARGSKKITSFFEK